MTTSRISRRRRPAPPAYHAVLTPVWAPTPGKGRHAGTGRRPADRLLWALGTAADPVADPAPVSYPGEPGLLGQIATLGDGHSPLTLWCPTGWEDLVGSGLAALMDSRDIRWKFCCLDGARVLLTGSCHGRKVSVTSLSAWTGGAWDSWREAVRPLYPVAEGPAPEGASPAWAAGEAEDRRCAVASVWAILGACLALDLGDPPVSVGAAARRWWAAWGSPRVSAYLVRPHAVAGRAAARAVSRPIPDQMRPAGVRRAEGHCAHGLVREQYYRGRVGGPIKVWDLRAAYLLALSGSPLPATYHCSPADVPPADLLARLPAHVGTALVRIYSPDDPYCVGRHGGAARAVGRYWTWLAGAELLAALRAGRVEEVRRAHLWWAAQASRGHSRLIQRMAPEFVAQGVPWAIPVWRSLYASLVGSWAQRSWAWKNDPRESQIGRWGTWTMVAGEGEELEQWRVLAGKVQRRTYRGLARHAHPVCYATVTSYIRYIVDMARIALPPGSVLATACDALWLTADGAEAAVRLFAPDPRVAAEWRQKDAYDDAWLDGRGSAVVRKGDLLYPLLPGVPHGAAVSADGLAHWSPAAPWTDGPGGAGGTLPPRRHATWDGSALIRRHSGPLEPVTPWRRLMESECPPELELAYDPRTARRSDNKE